MQYELVSRAFACLSCLSTMSLLLTSAAIVAVNVGKLRPVGSCGPYACLAGISIQCAFPAGGPDGKAH